MAGYTKNIAVLKGLKEGFSSDGGALTGLVRAEKYSRHLRVEISLINFAAPEEGRYVCAITDGKRTETVENCLFDGESEVDTGAGFAAAVCYVNTSVSLIAAAVCGDLGDAALGLKEYVERAENISPPPAKTVADAAADVRYEDEALAEDNYYEFDETHEGGRAVCEDAQKEEDGGGLCEDEKAPRPVEEDEGIAALPRPDFYGRMQSEIEGLLSAYPPQEELCAAVEGSRWVKISYGDGKWYVFGVIYSSGKPAYICYGVPGNGALPPESMRGVSAYLPVKCGEAQGFWVIYQDAATGFTVTPA